MTDKNGNVPIIGQQYIVRLPKAQQQQLRELAKFHGTTPTELANAMLITSIRGEYLMVLARGYNNLLNRFAVAVWR